MKKNTELAEATRLAKLEIQTKTNTENIEKIDGKLDGIDDKIDASQTIILNQIRENQAKSQITMPLILMAIGIFLTGLGIFITVGGLTLSPMKEGIKELKIAQLKEIDLDVKSIKDRAYMERDIFHINKSIEEMQQMVIGTTRNMQKELDAMNELMLNGLIKQRDELMGQLMERATP